MKQLDGYRNRLVLVGLVAAIVLGGGNANADFVFGEPTNLGPTVNSSAMVCRSILALSGPAGLVGKTYG